MKLQTLECPNCGGSIHVEEGRSTCFCTYCGKQIAVDDGTVHIRYTDDARIREAEVNEKIELEKLRHDEKDKAGFTKMLVIMFVIFTVILLFMRMTR